MRRHLSTLVILAALLPIAPGALGPVAPGAQAEDRLSALDAGARYGQALGVVEICIGAKVTEKAEALKASYTGDEAAQFEAQAAKVFEAWMKVKSCSRPDDPNQCKISMDRSCAAAIEEIGPAGAAAPGLIEPPPNW